jgi:hypothetical protein
VADDKRSYKGEVGASEILDKIEKGGDVEYDGYIIKGNLDIRGLKLLEEDENLIIDSNISIEKSRIDGSVSFLLVTFKKSINFEKIQVDHLTGLCRGWSILERVVGWLLMTSFLVVLAKKTLR